jgi:putative Holliday junction resolvase
VGRPPGELKAIAALVADNDVALVVIGDPRSMSGARGSRSHLAREFATALAALLAVPIELQDERLSSVEAERALRETGANGRAIRVKVDRAAATVILQAWLDAHRVE